MLTKSSVFPVDIGFVTTSSLGHRLDDFVYGCKSLFFSFCSGIPIRNSSLVLSVKKIASSIN